MSWPVRFLDISVSQHPNRYSWHGGVLVATLFCAISPTVASQTDLDAMRDALYSLGSGNYETAVEKTLPLAEQGNLHACGVIGLSYRKRGDHVRAYARYGIAGEQWLAAHQLEGFRLSPEELQIADELTIGLRRRYCRD